MELLFRAKVNPEDIGLQRSCEIAPTDVLEIYEENGGFLLISVDRAGDQTSDTWLPDIESAKRQAEFDQGVELDWEKC